MRVLRCNGLRITRYLLLRYPKDARIKEFEHSGENNDNAR